MHLLLELLGRRLIIVKTSEIGYVFRHCVMGHICCRIFLRFFAICSSILLLTIVVVIKGSWDHSKLSIAHTYCIRCNWTLLHSIVSLLVEASSIIREILQRIQIRHGCSIILFTSSWCHGLLSTLSCHLFHSHWLLLMLLELLALNGCSDFIWCSPSLVLLIDVAVATLIIIVILSSFMDEKAIFFRARLHRIEHFCRGCATAHWHIFEAWSFVCAMNRYGTLATCRAGRGHPCASEPSATTHHCGVCTIACEYNVAKITRCCNCNTAIFSSTSRCSTILTSSCWPPCRTWLAD